MIIHLTYTCTLPGSVGQFEDDVVGQVVNLPQPEVIGDVVPIHKGLEGTAGLVKGIRTESRLHNHYDYIKMVYSGIPPIN